MESSDQLFNLSNIEVTLTTQNFGYNTLAPNLWKIRLRELVLLHQETQGRCRRDFLRQILRIFIVTDERTERIGQISEGRLLVSSSSIKQLVQNRNGLIIVSFSTYRMQGNNGR